MTRTGTRWAWTETAMTLALRLTPAGDPATDPEDFFGDSLGVVFEDDTLNLRRCKNVCPSLVSMALHSTSSILELTTSRWRCRPWSPVPIPSPTETTPHQLSRSGR